MSDQENIRVLGGDPGVRSGGLAYLEIGLPGRVLTAHSLVETEKQRKDAKVQAESLLKANDGWGDLGYTWLSIRAQRWMVSFTEFFDATCEEFGPPHLIVLESFIDQAQHAKKMMKNRWHTPHLIGLLEVELRSRGYSVEAGNLIYQDAGTVIRQLSSEIAALESRQKSKMKDFAVLPGDQLITNDHMRKALAHALAAKLRIQFGTLHVPTLIPAHTN